MFEFLIVGAGFAGCVLAERIATVLNKPILIVEKRDHIGGNAYDFYNNDGILVHKYGPHWFHTNDKNVVNYLSLFTDWRFHKHRVRVWVDDKLLPFPINIDTINKLYGLNFKNSEELKAYFDRVKVNIVQPKNAEEMVLSRFGLDLYQKIFKKYTLKQWNVDPKELLPEVTGRIPIRYDHEDSYFDDIYQMMPMQGYTKLFERMVDNKNISVSLNTDYKDIINKISFKKLIYTGPVDEFFNYKYGKLPYRSVYFEHKTMHNKFYQEYQQINFPNHFAYTRIIEWKHATGQKHCYTTITKEYPCDPEENNNEKYYPVLTHKSVVQYQAYKKEADRLNNIYFCGRLAEFKYYNMDQVVKRALHLFSEIAKEYKPI